MVLLQKLWLCQTTKSMQKSLEIGFSKFNDFVDFKLCTCFETIRACPIKTFALKCI